MTVRSRLGLVILALCFAACGGGGGASSFTPGSGTGGGGGVTTPTTTSAYQHACPPAMIGTVTCYALIRSDAASIAPLMEQLRKHRADIGTYAGPLRPVDIARAYNVPPTVVGGGTPTIAIVDAYDDATAESDLSYYRQYFGLPACTSANGCFKKVNQRGAAAPYPSTDAGWSGEIALDLDVVSATCSACHIVLIEANDTSASNLAAAEDTAASFNPAAISNSYGGPEYQPSSVHYAHSNIVITASTGDGSFYGGAQQPASYPSVIAVGGTSLYADAKSSRGWDEFAWSNGGSGCSGYVARPAWQRTSVTGCTTRASSDVAAIADPFNPGIWVWNEGSWFIDGGTSAAAPLVASMYALANNAASLGANAAAKLYASPGSFFDITQGNNGYCNPAVQCSAGSGYDGPTGWGSPNGLGGF